MKTIVGKNEPDKNAVVSPAVIGNHPFRKRPSKKIFIVAICLVLAVVGALYLKYKSGKVSTDGSCSNDKQLIAKYNEVMQKRGATKLKEIAPQLEKKDTANDATCKYMLMMLQYGDTTTNAELETYKELKQLEKEGKSISKDIHDGVNRKSIEEFLQQKIENKTKNYYGEG